MEYHQRDMFSLSPPGTSFALDAGGLSGPEVTLLGAWEGRALVGMGALKRLSPIVAEIKSMRTHPAHLGRGIGRLLLDCLITTASQAGYKRFNLETGTSAAFAPAIALYTSRGFVPVEPFADYANGPHNQCYGLDLTAG